MLPERSSRSYMGLEPPSACLLTAADSLLSLFPMTESPSEKCEKKQGAVDCAVVDRPPSPSTLLSQLRHETKERTKAAGAAAKAVSRNDGKVHVIYRANKRTTDERTNGSYLGGCGIFLRMQTLLMIYI